jgi:hypothetical protein
MTTANVLFDVGGAMYIFFTPFDSGAINNQQPSSLPNLFFTLLQFKNIKYIQAWPEIIQVNS